MRANRIAIRIALPLVCVLLLAGCPNTQDMQKVALAAHDASVAVKVFQEGEIDTYRAGLISADDHQAVQKILVDVGNVGLTLDAGIRVAKSNAAVIESINAAVAQLSRLQDEGTLHIKNNDLKTKFVIALTGAKAALNAIAAVIG